MSWDCEKCIDFFYGEYKNGLFGKKYTIRIDIYPSRIEGIGFMYYDGELSKDTYSFEISYSDILMFYIEEINKQRTVFIDFTNRSVVRNQRATIVLLGIDSVEKIYNLIKEMQQKYIERKAEKEQIELQYMEEQRRLAIEKEENALKFYQDCYSFHVKNTTPVYQLFSDKNKVALIYVGDNKSLNFLKIDGYAQEENNGVILYENIHYYERAGNVSYTTDIHGNYSSFGGSMTGGKVSKLATVGGGLLFGFMGMALGAALTHKPAEQEQMNTSFSIDTDIRKIDDRSVILNFYSEIKKQYIDIELPQDIYNFLQTFLPEKKYGIVEELEKKTVVHQSTAIIENGNLLKAAIKSDVPTIEMNDVLQTNTMDEFKLKVEKLKMMREAGLLSDEKFEEEQTKLLSLI